jgi:hypothetical protein
MYNRQYKRRGKFRADLNNRNYIVLNFIALLTGLVWAVADTIQNFAKRFSPLREKYE